jgi:hypothetical protein
LHRCRRAARPNPRSRASFSYDPSEKMPGDGPLSGTPWDSLVSRDTQIGPLSFNPARSVILSAWMAQDRNRRTWVLGDLCFSRGSGAADLAASIGPDSLAKIPAAVARGPVSDDRRRPHLCHSIRPAQVSGHAAGRFTCHGTRMWSIRQPLAGHPARAPMRDGADSGLSTVR